MCAHVVFEVRARAVFEVRARVVFEVCARVACAEFESACSWKASIETTRIYSASSIRNCFSFMIGVSAMPSQAPIYLQRMQLGLE